MKTPQQGFTLIELMIVIAIIGILASVALPAYREYIVNSKLSSVVVSVTGIQRAIEKEHSRKGDGILTTAVAAKALTGATDTDFIKKLGMRGAPKNPNGVSAIALVAPATSVAGTCTASTNYAADGAISGSANGTQMTGGAIQLTLTDGIDTAVAGKNLTFTPVVTKTGIDWKAWSTAAKTEGEMTELVCRWISENVNGKDGTGS